MLIRIVIFVEGKVASLRDDLKEFQEHNSEHKESSIVIIETCLLKMNTEEKGRNDSRMINQMKYYVRLLLYFFRKNEKFLFQLPVELELFPNLLNQY